MMIHLPTTILAFIFTLTPPTLASLDPIYITNYTTYPNVSLSLTPKIFLATPGSNGTSSISASALLSPGSFTKYPLQIAVRDAADAKKPHFSSTQTLIWMNASNLASTGIKDQNLVNGWRNCLVFFSNVSVAASQSGSQDDGSCGLTLGSDCVGDLKMVLTVSGEGCAGLEFGSLPPSCEGKLNVTGSEGWSVADLSYNNQSYYPLLEVQTPLHRWDDPSYLQTAAQTVWPVLWYQSLNQAGIEQFNGSFANSSFKNMGCLRATTKNNGTTSDATVLRGVGHGQQWLMVVALAFWTAWNLS